ncbi:DNA-binding PucR family transcriptional regulator [Paenibacillus harenae]|uniref:DNA-binding PucR family transcriptional regulator n=1 Tax=Paenibacillus harenae TaxID=306543 RepID=A0ABT9UBA8_PAEHA|nr:helix-turn-helix domain-containing protein [Paenibacillus harenae]MDQ0116291.1 DNA-binding PucR family transcriptional regulator [Paenibacillus harenae]
MNETAKKLFIHRNTATYRIEKLSELLEVDLKKMNVLMRLKIAFIFRRMLLNQPFATSSGVKETTRAGK